MRLLALALAFVVSAPAVASADPPPTCSGQWHGVTSALAGLAADANGATVCAAKVQPGARHAADCVRVDFAAKTFTRVAALPAPPATPAPPKLEGVTGDDAVIDVSPDGAEAVTAIDATTYGVFDAKTGKRTRTVPAPVAGTAKCAGPAFWIGASLYVSARGCDDPDGFATRALLIPPPLPAGKRGPASHPLAPLYGGAEAKIALGSPHRWAVASLKPFSIAMVDDTKASVLQTIALPALDPAGGSLALGLTPFGVTPLEASPLVLAGPSSLVAVSSRAIAIIDLGGKSAPRIIPFPACK